MRLEQGILAVDMHVAERRDGYKGSTTVGSEHRQKLRFPQHVYVRKATFAAIT